MAQLRDGAQRFREQEVTGSAGAAPQCSDDRLQFFPTLAILRRMSETQLRNVPLRVCTETGLFISFREMVDCRYVDLGKAFRVRRARISVDVARFPQFNRPAQVGIRSRDATQQIVTIDCHGFE